MNCFPRLRLREGYRLVSYQYVESGNGNGFTFVIPEGMEPPGPSQLGVHSRGGFFSPYVAGRPRITGPKGMDPDVSRYLEGDGSPLSYLEASLWVREMAELGAVWHGSWWSAHSVLVADPRLGEEGCGVEGSELDMLRRADWKLAGPETDEWRPRVTLHPAGGAVVEFYTYCGLGTCQVTKHVDRYFQGYSFSSRHQVVLEGGLGYLF